MTANKLFLITRPDHDDTLSYLFEWSKDILNFAKANGIRYHDCKGPESNRKEVSSFIEKANPRFLFFNGHGGPDEILGHVNEILIKANDNDDLLNAKITYALSCNSADILGPSSIEKGADAFIGYVAKFGFVRDASRECTPTKDKFAKPFFEASNTFVLSILTGNTVGIAYGKSQRKYDELIRQYSTSDAMPEYAYIRFWLFWDKYFQKMLGNESAVF